MPTQASILFATNRKLGTKAGKPVFLDTPVAGSTFVCGRATVAISDPEHPPSTTIPKWTTTTANKFSDADLAPLLASSRDVLVFIHGAANTFNDGIARAAYNKEWLKLAAQQGVAADFDMIAFSWPGRSYDFWNIIGDALDYSHDRDSANGSAAHIAAFFTMLYQLKAQLGTRKIHLLCHSMGNLALGGGVEKFFKSPPVPAQPLFDQIVLAAPDETWLTFQMLNDGRLYRLRQLGRRVTVYHNYQDVLMMASHLFNGVQPLGQEGPAHMNDLHFFPRDTSVFVNCRGVNDYVDNSAPDRSHQYYRMSRTVRLDIAATLAGKIPQRLRYDANRNFYVVFPP